MRDKKRVVILGLDRELGFALNLDPRLHVKTAASLAEFSELSESFEPEIVIVDERRTCAVICLVDSAEVRVPSHVEMCVLANQLPSDRGWKIEQWIPARGKESTFFVRQELNGKGRKRGPKQIRTDEAYTLRSVASL